ncbi:MAG: heme biosynthesis HemY N-terminal domain-containing protein [Pseudomonadota bacterium]
MKRLIFIILALVALVATALLAPRLASDPGLVSIDIGDYRIQMSLLTLFGAVLVMWVAISLVIALIRLPGRMVRKQREYRAQRQLENGLLALTEGDFQRAEKELGKSLNHHGTTAGYLAAAQAAQGQSDLQARDQWLQLADRRFGRKHFVTDLSKARMLAAEGRIEEAVPILEALHLKKPKHSGVLRLLLQDYQDLDRWRDVRLLTPALRKAGIIDEQRESELATLAACREMAAAGDLDTLDAALQALGRKQRQERDIVLAYARRAGELGHPEAGGAVLRKLLKAGPDRDALKLYAQVDDHERAQRISDCESWLKQHPGHGGLHLALGFLYLQDRDYDKAKDHLEKSLDQAPDAEAYAALGRLHDRAGRLEAAAQSYRNALRLQQGRGVRALPAPE